MKGSSPTRKQAYLDTYKPGVTFDYFVGKLLARSTTLVKSAVSKTFIFQQADQTIYVYIYIYTYTYMYSMQNEQ